MDCEDISVAEPSSGDVSLRDFYDLLPDKDDWRQSRSPDSLSPRLSGPAQKSSRIVRLRQRCARSSPQGS